jgi:hypothetical protein
MHPEALHALRIDLDIWNALEHVQKVETSVPRSTLAHTCKSRIWHERTPKSDIAA